MNPDFLQLSALAAAVDEGTFELAAARLHVTPSAVSQRIKALETSAGRILVRRSRPIQVTEAGGVYLTLTRQIEALLGDAASLLGAGDDDTVSGAAPITVPLAINADSLATWIPAALAPLAGRIAFDLHREDQAHTAELLRSGTVMAAVTSDRHPVQGCVSTRLGIARYRAVAAPGFRARWFAEGVTADALAAAPVVVFDRKDELQDGFLRAHGAGDRRPPRHYVPGSNEFAEAVRLGFGWGMLPDQQGDALLRDGSIVELDSEYTDDVVLYWQQWSLRTPALDAVADAVILAARDALVHIGP